MANRILLSSLHPGKVYAFILEKLLVSHDIFIFKRGVRIVENLQLC